MVLVVLAVVWAVVLIPPWLRSRAEGRPGDSIGAFHRQLTAAGYRDNGAPGERRYHPGYYGAFVLDPDGNNVEVVNHNAG